MMTEDIFAVEGQLLVINKDYVRGISEFRIILERDRGSKGDMDGRKKYYAWKEFFYIYIRASMFSYPNKGGWNEKDTIKAAIKEAELPEDYKPDAAVKAAIEKYREIQFATLPALRTIATTLKGLKIADEFAEDLIETIEDNLQANKLARKLKRERKDSGTPAEPENIANEIIIIDAIEARLNKIMSIANKIPTTVQTLQDLEERLKKEQAGERLARGGRKIGNRAD